ncbi:unnamed protein product [Dracunculus medinensis]|uniref:Fucosyltransferase n=1 Tax=Dracunculus medinensis TaxID=318479 RepID=A0A0N4UQ50_DRAME|nr:unnamed protein product [Dracunculus medinensis]
MNSKIAYAMQFCSHKCDIIESRKDILKAGAVLFNVNDLRLNNLPKRRIPNQVYVLLNRESPHHTYIYSKRLPPYFFNLSMTYRLDSDFYYGYGRLKKITMSTDPSKIRNWKDIKKIVKKKKKSILQFVSHCYTPSKREDYVDELKRYINVTIFGKCTSNPSEHRFYLSFENSVCRDYITEKLFTRIDQLLIPIVLKKSFYRHILPDDSYIAADDFSSPKTLADYLSAVENNITEYMK